MTILSAKCRHKEPHVHIDGLEDADIRAILGHTSRVALVGASANPDRPSHQVARFLVDAGYDVTAVNPGLAGQTLHGRKVVATLDDAAPLDMVDLFRAADAVPGIVEAAIRLQAKTIWMQLGVVHEAAAAQAREAGIVVVMDRCPVIETARLRVTRHA